MLPCLAWRIISSSCWPTIAYESPRTQPVRIESNTIIEHTRVTLRGLSLISLLLLAVLVHYVLYEVEYLLLGFGRQFIKTLWEVGGDGLGKFV